MSADELLPAALALPLSDRAKLAKEILRSLDDSVDADSGAEWITEINRRALEVEDGSAELIDWDVARSQINQELAARR